MAVSSPPHRAGFRLLGFPITIGRGFFFVAVFLLQTGSRSGGGFDWGRFLFSLVAYTGFMLIHELGHAVAARWSGCSQIAISLDFLVGYASFRPPKDITKKRLAIVSAAGPVIQIVTGLVVLLAMGADITSHNSMRTGAFRAIVLLFGPVLGIANLIPILPLDGGHLVALGFEKINPLNGRRIFQIASLGMSIALAVYGLIRTASAGDLSVFLLPGIMLTMMNAAAMQSRTMGAVAPSTSAVGEDAAWVTGELGTFPPGVTPSPWLLAALALHNGDAGDARRMLLDSVSQSTGYWQLSDDAPHDRLLSLVELLPESLPVENLHGARTLHHVLHRLGFLRRASEYGAAIYERHRDPFTAHQVATELALLSHPDHAIAWLRSALVDPDERARLSDSGLDALRHRADFIALVQPRPTQR